MNYGSINNYSFGGVLSQARIDRVRWHLFPDIRIQQGSLFDKDLRTINEHVINAFEEGELAREATIRNFRIVRQEGHRQVEREIEHYNLDVIISVRVNDGAKSCINTFPGRHERSPRRGFVR